jgi:transcriptional regulator with XRE-family HTH domain
MRGRTVDGAKLRELREKAGLTGVALARQAGCTANHLYRIETLSTPGERWLSDRLAHQLIRVLSEVTGREITLDEFSTPDLADAS